MSKIRQSARYELCTLRIPGVCNFDPETTILGHLKTHGMGAKCSDIHSCYTCSACHDVIDGRVKSDYTIEELEIFKFDAMVETQKILIEKGLIKLTK